MNACQTRRFIPSVTPMSNEGLRSDGEGLRPLRPNRGFAFLGHETMAIDIGGAGRLFGEEALLVFTAVRSFVTRTLSGYRG